MTHLAGPRNFAYLMDPHAYSWTGRRVVVTGATGFIGYHLCRLLVTSGASVTAFVRASSDTSRIQSMGARCTVAPLEDPARIADACRDNEFLFHLAGAVDFNDDWDHCRRVNVEGTANVLQAAHRAGVRRVLHTSSIVAIGASPDPVRLNEESAWNLGRLRVPYVTTKHEAELLARQASALSDPPPGLAGGGRGGGRTLAESAHGVTGREAFTPFPALSPQIRREGQTRSPLEVVIVNPASVIGPDDITGSEFGLLCRRFWQRRIPFVFGGGSNFVDVRDVASGMLAAAERGRSGERYILGGANRSYAAFFSELAAAAKRSIARLRLPTGFARAGAAIAESLRRERRKRPLLTSSQAKLLGLFFYYDCSKAERELDYQPRPLSETIADTHDFWMVKRESVRRIARAA